MSISLRKYAAGIAAAGLVLGASIAVAATASATSLTCTNIAGATAPPIGCGGDQLAYQAKGILDLGVLGTGSSTGNYWNSPVGMLTDSTSAIREDWTVFAIDGKVNGGPGGLGEYVVMYTPDGVIPTTNSAAQPKEGTSFTPYTDDYCLSVENVYNGPKGAERWRTVLRNCNSNGEFEYGDNSVTPAPAPTITTQSFVTGCPAGGTYNCVSSSRANAYQVWAPVSGPSGLIMLNESLSSTKGHDDFANTPYVLDDTGFGGSGTQSLAFPENDGLNQQSTIIGCTDPIKGLESELPTGYYNCP